jgi:NTP pyrophosphatase (non-canonical NTP hydrolase)
MRTSSRDQLSKTSLSMNAYQDETAQTALYNDGSDALVRYLGADGLIQMLNTNYAIMGLAGEAGELANTWQKYLRGDDLKKNGWGIYDKAAVELGEARRNELIQELGGVLWFAARVAAELEVDFSTVAEENLCKLLSRLESKRIHGDGNDR